MNKYMVISYLICASFIIILAGNSNVIWNDEFHYMRQAMDMRERGFIEMLTDADEFRFHPPYSVLMEYFNHEAGFRGIHALRGLLLVVAGLILMFWLYHQTDNVYVSSLVALSFVYNRTIMIVCTKFLNDGVMLYLFLLLIACNYVKKRWATFLMMGVAYLLILTKSTAFSLVLFFLFWKHPEKYQKKAILLAVITMFGLWKLRGILLGVETSVNVSYNIFKFFSIISVMMASQSRWFFLASTLAAMYDRSHLKFVGLYILGGIMFAPDIVARYYIPIIVIQCVWIARAASRFKNWVSVLFLSILLLIVVSDTLTYYEYQEKTWGNYEVNILKSLPPEDHIVYTNHMRAYKVYHKGVTKHINQIDKDRPIKGVDKYHVVYDKFLHLDQKYLNEYYHNRYGYTILQEYEYIDNDVIEVI